MKKSIYLLLLLLIGCAPVTTVPLSLTVLPPTPTITPSATLPPSPTTTPEGFQTSEGGAVQVFENGKWVNMDTKIPDTIWGDKPEGASVVLKDGEAFLQMELDNFQTPDGATIVDIAKYNPDTDQFEVQPFSITRTSLDLEELYDGNYSIKKSFSADGVDFFSTRATILGFNVNEDTSGKKSLDVMILFKGKVSIVSPEEFTGNMLYPDGSYENRKFEFGEIDLREATEVVRMANKNFRTAEGYGYGLLYYLVLNNSATEESCKIDPSNWPSSDRFSEWCKAELKKELNRRIPIKGDLDGKLFNGIPLPTIGKDFDPRQLAELWDIPNLQVDGAFLQFGYNHQINK